MTPTLKKFYEHFCPIDWVQCTNIYGSYGKMTALDHKGGAALDIAQAGFEGGATSIETFIGWAKNDYDMICEVHQNNSDTIVKVGTPNSHLHCYDKWWREQREELKQLSAEKEAPKVIAEKLPYKVGGSDEQNEKVHYAWEISHDEKFVYMLECENGLWTPDRRHNPANNTFGVDWGWGVNDFYHSDIVYAENDRFFWDWKWQLREVHKMYKDGVRFYGLDNINKCSKNFEWK